MRGERLSNARGPIFSVCRRSAARAPARLSMRLPRSRLPWQSPPQQLTRPSFEFVPIRNCRSGWCTTPAFPPLFRRPPPFRLPQRRPRPPPKLRPHARVRYSSAQFVPAEAKKLEPQVQRKRKVAKVRANPPVRVAQQSQFGFFGGTGLEQHLKVCAARPIAAAVEFFPQTCCSRSGARLPLSGSGIG